MAMPFARRDIEAAGAGAGPGSDDSPAAKKGKPELAGARPALTRSEAFAFAAVLALFTAGIFCVFLTAPRGEFGQILRLPRSLADVRLLKDNLAVYARDYQTNFILGYCSIYIFMQTFMIPGTIFMSLLAGALFGVIKGGILVVFTATAGGSSCYFVSKLIGRPLVSWLWPEKLRYFQSEIAKRREKLLNYMLFLRITPTLPNTFINMASPIVDIPFHIFFAATLVGLIPASYITVKVSTLVVTLNHGCCRCFTKIWKTVCKLQETEDIRAISYDEVSGMVMISGAFDPLVLLQAPAQGGLPDQGHPARGDRTEAHTTATSHAAKAARASPCSVVLLRV